MISDKRKKIIKLSSIIGTIAVIIAISLFLVIRYQVEGEKNMPFKPTKIIVISSAVTSERTDNETVETASEENTENTDEAENQNTEQQPAESYIWDENVVQTNDVYIYISKNENYKDAASIKNVRIENIQILEKVKVGKIQVYMPNSLDEELYKYINGFAVGTSLTYTGGAIDNKKTLEIGSQGGLICLSFANIDLGRYQSNEDSQIEQGAFILEKMNLTDEDLKFKVSFDLIIDIGNKAYKGTYVLDLPSENLVGNKESHYELNDLNNVVFKRCKFK